MTIRTRLGWLAAVAAFSALPTVAPAVTILETTWEANGGTEGDKAAGFAANEALAQEQPFKGAVEILAGKGDDVGGSSGTWIGQDEEGRNYILTAAHVVWTKNGPVPPEKAFVVVGGTTTYPVQAVHINPFWLRGFRNDMAILVTKPEADGEYQKEGTEPLAFTDQSDEAPKLFCEGVSAGSLGTVVGFGRTGTGSEGSDEDYTPEVPVAAHNIIDGETDGPEEAEAVPSDDDVDAVAEDEAEAVADDDFNDPRFAKMLMTDFDSEEGDANTLKKKFDSAAKPVDELEGEAQQGDSGGPLWVKAENGWSIAGVVSVGERPEGKPAGAYGSVSYFAPVSESFEWISTVFPAVKFTDGGEDDCSWHNAAEAMDFTPDWEKDDPAFARYHIGGMVQDSGDDADEDDNSSGDESGGDEE